MSRQSEDRFWPRRRGPSWALMLSVFLLSNVSVVGAADRLVLLSPHWEGIKNEFERAFKSQYLRQTGRTVELEWMDVGGTSEAMRFLRSEFKNKPAGIGIDLFFGGGLEPYLALKQENLLESYVLPKELLEKIPRRLSGVPLYDPGHTWYGATLAGFGIVYNKVVLELIKRPVITTWEGLASPGRSVGWAHPIRARAAACIWRTRLFCRLTAGRRVGGSSLGSGPMCEISGIQPAKSLRMSRRERWLTAWRSTFMPGRR